MSTPAYATNPRALERWRREHLTLTPQADGGVAAEFRFEGSTCGNIPLTLLYRVQLGRAEEGFPLQTMNCVAAAGSDGHERMCSWLESNGRIMEKADAEKPLLGQRLDAVLAWRPVVLPAGCLCSAASRNHKWRAVLETVHYALHQTPEAPTAFVT